MSSHHIVKEKQEPALFIENLGHFSEEYLGQLLEWSPTLMVSAEAYEKIVSLGIKVDIVAAALEEPNIQENTLVLQSQGTALETAMRYLIEEKYPAVNIITADFHSDYYVAYAKELNVVVFTANEKHFSIHSGFSFWKAQGTQIRIHHPYTLHFPNLEHLSGNLYQVQLDGFVNFKFEEEYLFISEQL